MYSATILRSPELLKYIAFAVLLAYAGATYYIALVLTRRRLLK